MGAGQAGRIRVTQRDNGDYSDLIPTNRLFCERAKPLRRRNHATKCPECRNLRPSSFAGRQALEMAAMLQQGEERERREAGGGAYCEEPCPSGRRCDKAGA